MRPPSPDSFQVVHESALAKSRNLPHRKLWEEHAVKREVAPVPPHIDIELTNICDLACGFCETTQMKRPKGMMQEKIFQNTIQQIEELGIRSVKLNLWGESLLHPHLIAFIQYAKANSSLVLQFNTNANRLHTPLAQKLIQSGLDELTISIDGVTPDTYERLRLRAKYDRVQQNVLNYFEWKKHFQSAKPFTTLQIIRMKGNENEVEPFIQYWKPLADRISVTNISITNTKEILKYSLREELPYEQKGCGQLYQRLSILWDGSITVCCSDYEGALSIGNIQKDSLKDLWHGEKLSLLRERHSKRDFQNLICQNCSETRAYGVEK